MKPHVVEPMIPARAIAARLRGRACAITAHFAGTSLPVVAGLLRGSFVFLADLARASNLPVEVDFRAASSCEGGTESRRAVRILKHLRGRSGGCDVPAVEEIVDTGDTLHHIEGCDVPVVEEIVDTGHTLHPVRNLRRARGAARLEVRARLDAPSRRVVDIRATSTGFVMPAGFVVGHGIDHARRDRNLPCIGRVRFA